MFDKYAKLRILRSVPILPQRPAHTSTSGLRTNVVPSSNMHNKKKSPKVLGSLELRIAGSMKKI